MPLIHHQGGKLSIEELVKTTETSDEGRDLIFLFSSSIDSNYPKLTFYWELDKYCRLTLRPTPQSDMYITLWSLGIENTISYSLPESISPWPNTVGSLRFGLVDLPFEEQRPLDDSNKLKEHMLSIFNQAFEYALNECDGWKNYQ